MKKMLQETHKAVQQSVPDLGYAPHFQVVFLAWIGFRQNGLSHPTQAGNASH
jgi:hypothetical protein